VHEMALTSKKSIYQEIFKEEGQPMDLVTTSTFAIVLKSIFKVF